MSEELPKNDDKTPEVEPESVRFARAIEEHVAKEARKEQAEKDRKSFEEAKAAAEDPLRKVKELTGCDDWERSAKGDVVLGFNSVEQAASFKEEFNKRHAGFGGLTQELIDGQPSSFLSMNTKLSGYYKEEMGASFASYDSNSEVMNRRFNNIQNPETKEAVRTQMHNVFGNRNDFGANPDQYLNEKATQYLDRRAERYNEIRKPKVLHGGVSFSTVQEGHDDKGFYSHDPGVTLDPTMRGNSAPAEPPIVAGGAPVGQGGVNATEAITNLAMKDPRIAKAAGILSIATAAYSLLKGGKGEETGNSQNKITELAKTIADSQNLAESMGNVGNKREGGGVGKNV